jgi:hypothetical protein
MCYPEVPRNPGVVRKLPPHNIKAYHEETSNIAKVLIKNEIKFFTHALTSQ